jgi:hypothetical protein
MQRDGFDNRPALAYMSHVLEFFAWIAPWEWSVFIKFSELAYTSHMHAWICMNSYRPGCASYEA